MKHPATRSAFTDARGNLINPKVLYLVAYVFGGLGLMGLIYAYKAHAVSMVGPCSGLFGSGVGAFYEARRLIRKPFHSTVPVDPRKTRWDVILLTVNLVLIAFLTLVFVNAYIVFTTT